MRDPQFGIVLGLSRGPMPNESTGLKLLLGEGDDRNGSFGLALMAGERGVELGLALVESVAFTTSRQIKVSHFSFLLRWSSVYPENEGRSEAGRSAVRSC